MRTRIDRRFAALAKEGRAALITFLMGGDPDPITSLAVLRALPAAGADVIEIGMPSPIRWPTAPRSRPRACAPSKPA